MAYRYGHPTTSWSGIQQWLLGFSGKTRYVPRTGLDLNQRTRFMEKIVIDYFNKTERPVKKGKWHYKQYQLCLTIQKEFQQFARFVKENYEPQ